MKSGGLKVGLLGVLGFLFVFYLGNVVFIFFN